MLKRFNLTEDGFRNKFRSAEQDKGESPKEFITRLGSYLDRWIEMADKRHTFDDLKILVVYGTIC